MNMQIYKKLSYNCGSISLAIIFIQAFNIKVDVGIKNHEFPSLLSKLK
jgi:hypothetical protein